MHEAIAQHFSGIEATYAEFVKISRRRDPDRKHARLAARVTLAEQLLALEKLVSASPEAVLDLTVKREFGKRLSHLRSALALHQALWPTVEIDENLTEYWNSALEVAQIFHEFMQWGDRSFSYRRKSGAISAGVPDSVP